MGGADWQKHIPSYRRNSCLQTCGAAVLQELHGILKLADKYSVERLEAACRLALSFTATPSYKSIKNILDTGNDKTMQQTARKGLTDTAIHPHIATATRLPEALITTGGKGQ